MDEKGKKICEIKTPGYYVIIIDGIILIGGLIFIHMNYGLNIESPGVGLLLLLFTMFYLYALKKITIYEECIINGKNLIQFQDIESIELIQEEYYSRGNKLYKNLIYIRQKNGNIDIISMSKYGLKQIKKLVKYMEEFSNCDINNANEFLDMVEIEDKKEMRFFVITMGILIIIGIFIVWKIVMNFKKLGY